MTHLAPRVGWNYWTAVTLRLWGGCSWSPSNSTGSRASVLPNPAFPKVSSAQVQSHYPAPCPPHLPQDTELHHLRTRLTPNSQPSSWIIYSGSRSHTAHPKSNHPTPARKNCPESISGIRKAAIGRLLPVPKEKFIQLCFLFGWSVTNTQHLTLLDNSGQKAFSCLIPPFLVIPCAHSNFFSLLLQVLVQHLMWALGLTSGQILWGHLSPTPSQVMHRTEKLPGEFWVLQKWWIKGIPWHYHSRDLQKVSSSRKYC